MTIIVTIFALYRRLLSLLRGLGGAPQSSMVSQLELQGIGVQIVLLLKVRLIKEAYKVIDEGNGHDEGDIPRAVVIDNLQQFLLGIGGELFLKIPHNVLQDIVMLRRGGLEAQGLH